MPIKVERALEREADKRGLEGEERDRFVYGTMRKKFGWKPKREVDKSKKIKLSTTMTNKIIRLQKINSMLEPIVEFARRYDEYGNPIDDEPNYPAYVAGGAATAGLGYGGYRAHGAITARMAATPGMTYRGGARDLAATGIARTAGMVRGARTNVVEAAEAARSSGAGMLASAKDYYGRTVASAGAGAAAARTAINPAIARTARAGRQVVAGALAGKASMSRIGAKKLLTHTRPTVKKLIKAVGGAAVHTRSVPTVDERLIQLGAK